MTPRRRNVFLGAAAAAVATAMVGWPILAQEYSPVLTYCPPCVSALNQFVRADVDVAGKWVAGTTGGDPDTALDDNRRLLYGFGPNGVSQVGTSFVTVRLESGTAITNAIAAAAVAQHGLVNGAACPPACSGACPPECDGVVTAWQFSHPGPAGAGSTVVVTQTLEPLENPYSGRPDMLGATYTAVNLGSQPVRIGLRALLDVRVGDNDGAPYIIPGVGALSTERQFNGPDVPDFWIAFESPTYEPDELRAMGLLKGFGLTPPDSFIVGRWGAMQFTRWHYAVDPTATVTLDSAVALYWDPINVEPGGSRTLTTAYGIAANRGGGAFLSLPVSADCDEVSVALFVSNFEAAPLTDGTAVLTIDPGLALAPGEQASKPVPDIAPGDTASLTWSLVPVPGPPGTMAVGADVTFAGDRHVQAATTIQVDCDAPTPTPITPTTPDPTATSSVTPTPTDQAATPTITPSPTAAVPPTATAQPGLVHCDFLDSRVPAAYIASALANPASVHGFGQLCFPNRPESPFNHPKMNLSMRNIAAPFHQRFNPLVFKCGCP